MAATATAGASKPRPPPREPQTGEPGGRVVGFVTSPPARRISGRGVVRWNGRSTLVPVLCVPKTFRLFQTPRGPLKVNRQTAKTATKTPVKRPNFALYAIETPGSVIEVLTFMTLPRILLRAWSHHSGFQEAPGPGRHTFLQLQQGNSTLSTHAIIFWVGPCAWV